MSDSRKPWGGRFAAPTAIPVEQFTASVGFDARLYRQDIACSIAHARMLAEQGVLKVEDSQRIVAGLEEIRTDIEQGRMVWDVALEDVHMNIEAALRERIGDTGARLHTARSRNDQVATDLRLYLKEEIAGLLGQLEQLLELLAVRAREEADTLMPGMTHLQYAQPVTLGHHLLAWFEMLLRDRGRLVDCHGRMDECPLGAAALAGTGFAIDRERSAELLGFARVAQNSMDAVSDRDFCIEFCSASAMLMMHLSRMAEELVLWSSSAFAFISLPDELCTGSSIMPQKKNPDVPELVRGKSGRVYGHLVSLLTLMKAQPLTYNRDNQEDKEPVFDTVDTVRACVQMFALLIPAFTAHRERLRELAGSEYMTATDLADQLAAQGMPFRDAHRVVAQAVARAMAAGCPLDQLESLEVDAAVLAPADSVRARTHTGGTAPDAVRHAAAQALERIRDA